MENAQTTPFLRATSLLQRQSSWFKVLQAVIDAGLVATVLVALLLYDGQRFGEPYQVLVLVTLLLMRIVYGSLGLYRTYSYAFRTTLGLAKAWGMVALLLVLFGFATKTSEIFSRQIIFSWFVLGYFAQLAAHLLIPRLLREAGSLARPRVRAVMVGAGRLGQYLSRRINDNPYISTRVVAVVDDDAGLREAWSLPGVRVAGTIDQLYTLARQEDVDAVILAIPMDLSSTVERVYRELHELNLDIFWAPDIFSLNLINHSLREIAGVPLLTLSETPLRGTRALAKSIEDRIIAAMALLIFSPIMVLAAVAVRLESPGPIIFKQRRHGWNGETFEIWKFRSMRVHPPETDGSLPQATRGDCRCTRLGRFLRRTSIDELPQLFNVLAGTMSLVGPRPHAVEHNDYYANRIQSYMARHRIKPGITGLAQVSGFRGETETLDKMKRRVEYDLHYINSWSIWLDLRIMLQTIFILFAKEAY